MKKLLQFTSTIRREKEELVSATANASFPSHSTGDVAGEPAKPSLLSDTYHGQILDKYNDDDEADDGGKAWHTGIHMHLCLFILYIPHYNLIYTNHVCR